MGRLRPLLPAAVAVVAVIALVLLVQQSQPGPEVRPTVESAPPVGGDFEASATVLESLEVTGPVRLDFRGFNGSLSIKPGAPGKLEIKAFKTAYGPDNETARKQANDLPLTISQEKDSVVFDARPAAGLPWAAPTPFGHIDYVIIAPEQAGLSVAEGRGSIKVSGLHLGVEVSGDDLPVRLTNVRGDISVAIQRGNVDVDGADGPMKLSTRQGDIKLKHVSGPSLAVEGSGIVAIAESSVTGPLTLATPGSKVSLSRLQAGQLEVKAPTAAVEMTEVGAAEALRLQLGSGSVWVERASAHPLAIATGGTGVELIEVQGDIEVATAGGPLTLSDATPASLTVDSGGGDVVFSGSLPTAGAVTIDTGGGQIYMTVARETPFALDADAGNGLLNVDRVFLDGQTLEGSAAQLNINGGGPAVQLRTHGGTLRLGTR